LNYIYLLHVCDLTG